MDRFDRHQKQFSMDRKLTVIVIFQRGVRYNGLLLDSFRAEPRLNPDPDRVLQERQQGDSLACKDSGGILLNGMTGSPLN